MFLFCLGLMRLDQFLKWQGWVSTGGEAKTLVQTGQVTVNGVLETQRGRKLRVGDQICMGSLEAIVTKILI